ncbi:hypothetical protein IKG38_00100 [Candidatus Saccharibacteria bacterium]|nr:hypothetical protein [Candidatus Saccharibacteria bacterium]
MEETLKMSIRCLNDAKMKVKERDCYNIINGPSLKDLACLFSASSLRGYFVENEPLSITTAEAYLLLEGVNGMLKIDRVEAMWWGLDEVLILGTYRAYVDDCDNFAALYNPKTRRGVFYFL